MENNKPLISIVVPCYNQAQYLDECLQSVLEQTYSNWECIIVNDGSPDNTEEVALRWGAKDSRFKYYKKKNGGLSSARNAGIKESKGEWVQFLDCDDLIEKKKIELSVACFKDESLDVIVSGYRYFETDEGIDRLRIFGRDHFLPEVCLSKMDKEDIKFLFKEKNPFVISAPIYKKKIFYEQGGFNEQLKSLEDWEFNLRCALNDYTFQHIGYQEDSKTLIRLHNSSMMRNEKQMNRNHALLFEVLNQNKKYVDLFGENEPFFPSFFSKRGMKIFLINITPPVIYRFIKRQIQ